MITSTIRNDNTQLSILDALNHLAARLPPPSSPPPSVPPLSAPPSNPPPGLHPGHPDHAMDTGPPSFTPRAGGNTAAGQAG
jgi:hypothetical protein